MSTEATKRPWTHSPLPWSAVERPVHGITIADSGLAPVCYVRTSRKHYLEISANAALIVQAVNERDALLTLLGDLQTYFDDRVDQPCECLCAAKRSQVEINDFARLIGEVLPPEPKPHVCPLPTTCVGGECCGGGK